MYANFPSQEFKKPIIQKPLNGDTTFGLYVFNISMAEIESVIEPASVTDDICGKPVAFLGGHGPILSIWAS